MTRSLRVEPTPDCYIEQAVENRQQKKSYSLRIAGKLTTPRQVSRTCYETVLQTFTYYLVRLGGRPLAVSFETDNELSSNIKVGQLLELLGEYILKEF